MPFGHGVQLVAIVAAALAATGVPGASGAQASALRMTVEKPHFTCESRGIALSHVVFHPEDHAGVKPSLPCCASQLGCAQFLSTNTVLHLSRQHRS
jgi:hypothetical protein